MKFLYFVLACVILGTLFYGVRFFLLRSKSKVLVQQSVAFEQKGDTALLPFLFAGDSTGVGIGASRSEETFAGYFGKDFPNRPIKNISKSGRKTEELVSILQAQKSQSAQWVFVQIGGNDILYFTPHEKLADHIVRVVREGKRVGKHVVLLTSGNVGNAPFFPRILSSVWTRKTLQVRELFTHTAETEGVLYVDLFQERSDDVFLTNIPLYYSSDLLHPSGEGYNIWYAKTREVIRDTNVESEL